MDLIVAIAVLLCISIAAYIISRRIKKWKANKIMISIVSDDANSAVEKIVNEYNDCTIFIRNNNVGKYVFASENSSTDFKATFRSNKTGLLVKLPRNAVIPIGNLIKRISYNYRMDPIKMHERPNDYTSLHVDTTNDRNCAFLLRLIAEKIPHRAIMDKGSCNLLYKKNNKNMVNILTEKKLMQ